MAEKIINMLRIPISISVSIIITVGCISKNNTAGKDLSSSALAPANLQTDSVGINYTKTAIKVLEDGSILEGSESITEFNIKNSVEIDTSWILFNTKANKDYDYEIGAFISGVDTSKYLIITRNSDSSKRVFEFTTKSNYSKESKDIMLEIDSLRTLWMTLCNSHKVVELVQKLYADSPIYFNHKPPITDPDLLIAEYAYMKNPKYTLHLEPEHVELVNNKIVYEIGQCSGGYHGKYIFIWRMNDAGEWEVLLDSNI